MKRVRTIVLFCFLLLLTACSEAKGPAQAPTPTPRPTPAPVITPTPTVPNVPARTVSFQTADHVQLAGLLYGQGKTAVVCSHELRTSKAIWSDSGIPQRLAQRGYLVLAYDFRGNGDSSGNADVSKLADDLRAAIAYVRQQGATKIVLLGSSMGGTATLKVAASEPVAAIVTLSAPQNFGVDISDDEVKAIKAAKLFVNSEGDSYTNDTQHMYDIAGQPKEIKLYPGSAHGTSNFDGTDLIQRILDFVLRYAPVSQ